MKIDVLPIGLYQENIYVLHDHGHVLVIDPGRYAKQIASCIEKNETVDGIILTHGHEDHTGAVDDLTDLIPCRVFMHPADMQLTDPSLAVKTGYSTPVYHEIEPLQEQMQIGIFPLTVYHTPGHTSGSVCVRYRNVLFTGDTLFASSIGRTDLFSGNDKEMLESIEFLKTLPADLRVCPGHGPASTIGEEVRRNPYFNGFYI